MQLRAMREGGCRLLVESRPVFARVGGLRGGEAFGRPGEGAAPILLSHLCGLINRPA